MKNILETPDGRIIFDFVAARARNEGRIAFYANEPRQAPGKYGTYSGAWIDGWDSAALASQQAVATH